MRYFRYYTKLWLTDVLNIRTCYSPDRPANKFWISLFAGRKFCRMWLGARFSVHARVTRDLRQHWHMRITSSKCVLQQRHLLSYQSRTPTLNPNPRTHPNPNPIFNRNPNNVCERKQKWHRNIGQHRVIFKGYLLRDGVGLSEAHNPKLEVFLIRYACAIPVSSRSTSVYLQHTLTPPKPLFCSWVPFRSFARRAVRCSLLRVVIGLL